MEKHKKLTPKQIEKLATEIREILLKHEMWIDTTIYFNGKAFSTHDKVNDKYYYNDREHLVVLEDENPRRYFEYVGEILSMSFEGPMYDMLNYGGYRSAEREFDALLKKYGLFYELGHSWNLTLCYNW